MKKKKKNNKNEAAVVTFLDREQIDCLDKVGKDSFFKYGRKLSRSKILSELVDLLIRLESYVEKLDLSDESLCEGVLKLLRDRLRDAKPAL